MSQQCAQGLNTGVITAAVTPAHPMAMVETLQPRLQQIACSEPYYCGQHVQGPMITTDPDMQQLLQFASLGQYPHPITDKSRCPESRMLYNQLVDQLSLAACEVQLEHMVLRTASGTTTTSSNSSSSFSSVSRHNSISGPTGINSRPGSVNSSSSPISTDAFQSLLFKMLEEEWAAHTQGPSE